MLIGCVDGEDVLVHRVCVCMYLHHRMLAARPVSSCSSCQTPENDNKEGTIYK